LDPKNSLFIRGIMELFRYYIFILICKKILTLRPQISWLSFKIRIVCYLCAVICTGTEVASGIENASDKELMSVWGRNLYDTFVTNSILESQFSFVLSSLCYTTVIA